MIRLKQYEDGLKTSLHDCTRMKKTILTLIVVIANLCVITAKDRVINNPVYEFNNTGITHVTKIELGGKETRLHVHEIIPNWWVKFPKTSYIEDCATGKRWQATGIINGEFDKEIYMPESGDSTFVLIFPPLDKSVTKINLCVDDENDKSYNFDDENKKYAIFGISLDPKAKPRSKEIPIEVMQWIDDELAKSKRKTLMDFNAGEFFATDTARLIGYINGYDPRAGFSTGMIYAKNVITREDFPVVVQIHEDGRFEAAIPMNYPEYMDVIFNRSYINFYTQPGQTLAILLDWEAFTMANRLWIFSYKPKNTRYQGVSANINNELSAFKSQLPALPFGKFFNEMDSKNPNEFKSFYEECMSDYSTAYQRLLETEKLSEQTKTILKNNFQMMYVSYLFDYEMRSRMRDESPIQLPLDFYDFLQDIPMNNKELLSTPNFSTFINRFEYCQPFDAQYKIYVAMRPEKSYEQYLFEELNIQKTPEDEVFFLMQDSIYIKLNSQYITNEEKKKLREEWDNVFENFEKRYEQHYETYEKKYVDVVKTLTQEEIGLGMWQIKDSVYTNELKLMPGIVYDVTKIRTLDNIFKVTFNDNKEEAWNYLAALTSDIPESFLRKEADRLFRKNFPEVERTAYELPDTPEAQIFKELIAPFKGKVLLVDFWATTCGPCVSNIKQQKELRKKYRDSPDMAFIFITSESESPAGAYNNFVEEQELIHTYRLNADQYRYLRQLFRFNGIPRYVLVDGEGNILDDNFISHNIVHKLNELFPHAL